MDSADLLLFQHLVRKGECERGVETAALLVAEGEYPGLDVARYLGKLDYLGRRARKSIAEARAVEGDAVPRIVPVLRLLYQDRGYRGNVQEYYDPRNSFLNQVIDRKLGIPITMAILLLGVCRRAGVEARGVSFPGHFLVRTVDVDGAPLFVDPFDGRILDEEALQMLYEQVTGSSADVDPACLEPVGCRQILARLLNNLRAIYEVRGDRRRLNRVMSLMSTVIAPEDAASWNGLYRQATVMFPVRAEVN